MAKGEFNAVGRRKKAIARVRLVAGDGKITINKRDIDNYFGLETLKMTVRQPLNLTNTGNYDVFVNVNGGGLSGQAGAISVADAGGNVSLTAEVEKSYDCVVVSCPQMAVGDTITVSNADGGVDLVKLFGYLVLIPLGEAAGDDYRLYLALAL